MLWHESDCCLLGLSEVSVAALSAIHVFHHLTACSKYRGSYRLQREAHQLWSIISYLGCNIQQICDILQSSLSFLPQTSSQHLSHLHKHLLQGAVLISLGQDQLDLATASCPGLKATTKIHLPFKLRLKK